MEEFPAAPPDVIVKVVSGFLVVTLAAVSAVMVVNVSSGIAVLFAIGYLGVIGMTWAMAPSGYRIQGGDLVVERNRWQPFRARLLGIAEVDDPRRMGLRVGGSGGGFGYYGRFRRGDIGTYRAYLTSRAAGAVIALQTSEGIVTVSPEDPAAMIRSVTGANR